MSDLNSIFQSGKSFSIGEAELILNGKTVDKDDGFFL